MVIGPDQDRRLVVSILTKMTLGIETKQFVNHCETSHVHHYDDAVVIMVRCTTTW